MSNFPTFSLTNGKEAFCLGVAREHANLAQGLASPGGDPMLAGIHGAVLQQEKEACSEAAKEEVPPAK